ncbi:coenzyme F430 synthase [Methanobrevibacter sp.]|uniref:coenzyme F430 synthase n=1 Tax=Methanobrevibacter sp. TaxID=66852 RepID=UPI00388FE5AB
MHYLVIDLTHGGVKIAVSLAKKGKVVHAYDIYNTLKPLDREMMEVYDIYITGLDSLKNLKGDICVISPIHSPLTEAEIEKHNPDLNYTFLTHHQAVGEILKDWGKDILKIEVTGVKGKTSSVFMLKEILIDENPLILSSLGALLYENEREFVLKKNISITPANIKETIDLAYKIANPVCLIADGKVESENLKKYNSAIFESSLGCCGIGDVGLLTNIAEDYPIAKNRLSASDAKSQVFMCDVVACQKESYDRYYSGIGHDKVNTFSLTDKTANLCVEKVTYTLDETSIDIIYNNVKTIKGNTLNGEMSVKTFAPGSHHVLNVLGVVTASLSCEIAEDKITDGLENYKGIAGRTNKRAVGDSIVIEEINPGINTEAIKKSIEMIDNLDDYYVAVGGDYGITCEEIDEDKLSDYLDTTECNLILTGDVGKAIQKKMSKEVLFMQDYADCYDYALNESKNLLFIYRSDYRKITQR